MCCVKVEVVARQVGEDGGGETHLVDAAKRQRVRRHFHRAGAASTVDHLAQEALNVGRFGRRARRLTQLVANPVRHRAEHAAWNARGFEDGRDQIRGRGLSVRPGDADHLHLCARVAEERGSELRKRQSPVSNHRPRHA